MNILSLFDGMSCGQIALERAGIKVDNYFASEIDKYAIQITQKNYPNTVQLGDVTKWRTWKLPHIDLLIAGSPCQGFSLAGNLLNFEDPRSKLFFEFVDILGYYKPKYFLLENVRMKKEWSQLISNILGVDFVEINSSLVSAQNRKRLYWANFEITQPEDKGILLKNIIESGEVDREKSYCLDASYYKGGSEETLKRLYYEKSRRQVVVEGVAQRGRYNSDGSTSQRLEPNGMEKANALTTVQKDSMLLIDDGENKRHRMLTPLECERLQTVPENYTEGVSNTQRYKMLGNGWTVDVIAHILKGIRNDKASIV